MRESIESLNGHSIIAHAGHSSTFIEEVTHWVTQPDHAIVLIGVLAVIAIASRLLIKRA